MPLHTESLCVIARLHSINERLMTHARRASFVERQVARLPSGASGMDHLEMQRIDASR
jgi:hypothetical protein